MTTLIQDLRYGLRTLLHNPAFAIVSVLTLALGIGANTAIFSVVNAVLLRPLPYPNAPRLVWITHVIPDLKAELAAGADYLDWREQNHSFDNMAAYDESASFNLAGRGRPERLVGASVTSTFFATLGVKPILGRPFTVEEDLPGGGNVAIITNGFWKRRLNSDPHVIGQTLSLNDQTYTIVGVMPPAFRFPGNSAAELLTPLALNVAHERLRMQMRIVRIVGLLKPTVTAAQARQDLDLISQRSQPQSPPPTGALPQRLPERRPAGLPLPPAGSGGMQMAFRAGGPGSPGAPSGTSGVPPPGAAPFGKIPRLELKIIPLQQQLVGTVRVALLVLLGAVGLVLLIACANVANLMVTRASLRSREIGVRVALGAGRWRLGRQLLTESVLLSTLGGVLGLILATWGVRTIVAVTPPSIAGDIFRLVNVKIDAWVLGFTLLVAVLTGILFGLAPAAAALKPDLCNALKEGSGSSPAAAGNRLRGAFVVLQCGLALVLLTSAGLLLKSFYRLLQVDPGFRAEKVLTLAIRLPETRYPWLSPQTGAFFKRLLERVETLPSVSSAGLTDSLPLTHYSMLMRGINIEGGPPQPPNADPVTAFMAVSRDYFHTMGIALLKGREFSEADVAGGSGDSPNVLMVNETMARHYWPGEDPVGRRLSMVVPGHGQGQATVVGVVADVRHEGLEAEVQPEIYRPYLRSPMNIMALAVRTSADPTQVVNAIRQAVWALDSEQPVYDVSTMEERLSESVAPRRFNLLLLGIFAVLALGLAAVGIYGVMSYAVTARTHEIGVRMALGASGSAVLKLVVGGAVKLAFLGVVVGIFAALAVTRLISSLLYQTRATDIGTFTSVSLLLLAVAFLAAYIPARRATKVDPMVALRYE